MTTSEMTDKQRRALEALEAAHQQGCSLVEYAQRQGLVVRELYDALAALRRKGVLPKAARSRKSKFVSVRVAPASTATMPGVRPYGSAGVLCRIVPAGGCVIECLQWPPAGWVAALSAGSADAAS